jgi:UDP-N-acetyl-D-mannosaminuronic acid transferase (WecB/TagA/CpsF family)
MSWTGTGAAADFVSSLVQRVPQWPQWPQWQAICRD